MRKLTVAVVLLTACTGRGGGGRVDSTGTGVASRTLIDEPSAVIDSARGMILGIRAGMTADSVKQVLGTPLREGNGLSDSIPLTVLEFPVGTVSLTATGGVVSFLCGGDDCRTFDHVGIGDSSDVILTTYGPTPPRGPIESPEAMDYRLGSSNCNLTFTLASGRVTSLALGCVAH